MPSEIRVKVDPRTFQFERAVKDSKMAHSICKRLLNDNDRRIKNDAAIMKRYNDEQPWSNEKLKAAGQGWRKNFSTGFLSSITKRAMLPYLQVIQSARTLTSSALKESSDDSDKKSKAFQFETTKIIRRWVSWNDFCSQLVLETILFGRCAINWSDEIEWAPRLCRTDEGIFPDGTSQIAKEVNCWMLRQNFLPHELAVKLQDPETAKAWGWNVDNVVKAINKARPENRDDGLDENSRKAEDTIRESTLGFSYEEGVKIIETYHLFVQELTGKVSHYLITKDDGDELFTKLDRFESMEQCLALFCLEVGNGKLHGSKGLGRILYNTSIGVEQSRMLILDNLFLAGLIFLQAADTHARDSAQITVVNPICVIGDGWKLVEVEIKVNDAAWMKLDQLYTQMAEMQAGIFMPHVEGGNQKASYINYIASIEQQIKQGILARFWNQFMLMIAQMQKRIFSSENIQAAFQKYQAMQQSTLVKITRKMYDFMVGLLKNMAGYQPIDETESLGLNQEAIDACLSLLEQGLTPEEIFEISQSNPNASLEDISAQIAQAMDVITARYLGRPGIRQTELMKADISSKLGHAKADTLVIPEEDNTESQEAVRQQLLETVLLAQGEDVPVSPRDRHDLHMRVLQEKAMQFVQQMQPQDFTKETLAIAKNYLKHHTMHLQAFAPHATPAQAQEFANFNQMASGIISQAEELATGKPSSPLPAGVVPAVAEASRQSNGTAPATSGPVNTPRPAGAKPNNALSRGPMDLTPKAP